MSLLLLFEKVLVQALEHGLLSLLKDGLLMLLPLLFQYIFQINLDSGQICHVLDLLEKTLVGLI
jgi:hypothetical protein